MDIKKINYKIEQFSIQRDWNKYHSPKNIVMALTGEVGELNEIFQWLTEEQSNNLPSGTKQHAKEEVADIAIYLLKLCTKLDIDLEEAIIEKMKKNEEKYPIDKVKGSFKKYTDI
ncbi:nucleotide pyrophosphohydrolase [Sulfurimonas aquatica]|uniref:Nucleotide pyrophosphohydrolase n=1 Tax=Sulfurimonas aquatica TaxID=2672570 RepID=A0A975AZC2_9BACT|nr:nucleotide pyrophosphohydrolase [Sulfurimonas aquatica]QSZ41372.1 nucleotide pyrophosphohydrolase [Sulfurimonas aquatica]